MMVMVHTLGIHFQATGALFPAKSLSKTSLNQMQNQAMTIMSSGVLTMFHSFKFKGESAFNPFWLTACLPGMLIDVHGLFMHMPLVSMDPKLHGPTINIMDITHYLLICCLQLRNGHRRLKKSQILD